MAMPHAKDRWTLEMVHALPDDGNRYELIDGELFVTPSPATRHQRASFLLALLLAEFTRAQSLELLHAPCAVRLPDGGEVQPDLLAFPRVRGADLPETVDVASLVLVVEILSPSTARHDRQDKLRLYQSSGVAVYWIVDLDAHVIERWRPYDAEPAIVRASFAWQPAPGGDALHVDVAEYFRTVFE